MKEILGFGLKNLFDAIDTSKEVRNTYSSKKYEVWEIPNMLFDEMCKMQEQEFVKLAGENAWWRSAEGSIMNAPNAELTINNKKIIGWAPFSPKERSYDGLLDYFCYGLGVSQPRNVCALVVDLAKYNHTTMSEIFDRYEPSKKENKARRDMSNACKFLWESFEQFKQEYPNATTNDWDKWYKDNCSQCIYECDICMYGEE